MLQLRLKTKAKKQLDRISQKEKYRILRNISKLTQNPYIGKKLSGELAGTYSLRIWPYRIIYQVFSKQKLIIIERIGHRQGIYK